MNQTPLPRLSDIAAAADPERLLPRKCVGCTQTDLDRCKACYRTLYPHYAARTTSLNYRTAQRVVRENQIEDFIKRFVDETGYGVDASWIWLNLKLDPIIALSTLNNNLRRMVAAGSLRKTIVREGRSLIAHYWPADRATQAEEA